MADQQELIILLQAQLGDTLGQLKAVQNQVTSMGSAAQGAAAPVTGLGSTFGAVLGGVALTALAKLSRKMVQFGKDAVDAFTKSDAAAKEFANTLEQRGLSQVNAQLAVGAVEQMAVPAGFDPQDIQQAMSNVIVKMHSGADAVTAFQSAMDNARIKGISLATSIQSVTIAAEGSLKSLRQFGITTNKDVNGNLKTEAQLLKEIAENTKGGLVTYMNSPLGMIDRMKVSLQQLKESLGENLTSVFAPVAQLMTGISNSLVAAAAASTVTRDSLNGWLVLGTQIGAAFANIRFVFRQIGIEANPKNWFDKDARRAAFEDLNNDWIDSIIATENTVRDAQNYDPAFEVAKRMREIRRLFADIQTGADDTTKSTEKWMAAFAPLKLLSGSVPNLAKYVGNLSSSFVLRSKLDININDNTKPASTPALGSVKTAVNMTLRQATRGVVVNTNSSHGSDMFNKLFGAGAGGTRLATEH